MYDNKGEPLINETGIAFDVEYPTNGIYISNEVIAISWLSQNEFINTIFYCGDKSTFAAC
jgi:hypothetical protein